MSKRKNISRTIKNGTILRTRDEFIMGGKDTKTAHPSKNDLFRAVVVIETNIQDELGIVKLTTKGKHHIPDHNKGVSTYKPILEIFDSEGRKIRISSKFVISREMPIPNRRIVEIKKHLYKKASSNTRNANRYKVRFLKGRK